MLKLTTVFSEQQALNTSILQSQQQLMLFKILNPMQKQDLRLYEGIFIYPILFVYKSVYVRDSFEQINNPGLIE